MNDPAVGSRLMFKSHLSGCEPYLQPDRRISTMLSLVDVLIG